MLEKTMGIITALTVIGMGTIAGGGGSDQPNPAKNPPAESPAVNCGEDFKWNEVKKICEAKGEGETIEEPKTKPPTPPKPPTATDFCEKYPQDIMCGGGKK